MFGDFLLKTAKSLSDWLEQKAADLAVIEQAENRILALIGDKERGRRMVSFCKSASDGIVRMSHLVESAAAIGIPIDYIEVCVAHWDHVGKIALECEMQRRAEKIA